MSNDNNSDQRNKKKYHGEYGEDSIREQSAAAAAAATTLSLSNRNKQNKVLMVKKKVQRAMWKEAKQEALPLTIGAISLLVSSMMNQMVPKVMGALMENPHPITTTVHNNNNGNKINVRRDNATALSSSFSSSLSFVLQIVSLATLGGMASFVRTYCMTAAQVNIASRLRNQAFASLLLHKDMEWFQGSSNHDEDTEENEEDYDGNENEGEKGKEEEERVNGGDSHDDNSNTVNNVATSMTPAMIAVILKDDVDKVSQTMTTTLANFIRSTSSCIFGTYHMLCINPQLLGWSLCLAPMVGAVGLASRKYISKLQIQQQQTQLEAAMFVEERLQHLWLVKLCHRQYEEVQTYTHTIQSKVSNQGKQMAIANGFSMGILFTLGSSTLCGILLLGRQQVIIQKKMTMGQLTSFGTYSFLLALGTAGIVRAMSDYQLGLQSGIRLFTTLIFPTTTPTTLQTTTTTKNVNTSVKNQANKETVSSSSGTTTTTVPTPSTTFTTNMDTQDSADAVEGKEKDDHNTNNRISFASDGTVPSIIMDRVCFAYRSHPQKTILQDISLKLTKGQVIAVVGKNGSGKSTIVSLFTGMYQPTSGNIHVVVETKQATLTNSTITHPDKTTTVVSHLDYSTTVFNHSQRQGRHYYQSFVQVVPQQPALFDMSILENVRYSRPNATQDEVWKALRMAHADTFVSQLPMSSSSSQSSSLSSNLDPLLQYRVGQNGNKVSGGQCQKIALARAFLARPSFLILDEPNSSMDVESELAFNETILEHCSRSMRRPTQHHKQQQDQDGQYNIDEEDEEEYSYCPGWLIITHRWKTLQVVDHVLVLKDGRIVEEGTVSFLQQHGTEFQSLMATEFV